MRYCPDRLSYRLFTAAIMASCLVTAACKKSEPGPGTERGACYGNSTCNAGLTCLSGLCVAASSASSKQVSSSGPGSLDFRRMKQEAAVQLNKIGKNAKRVYVETSAFTVGSATTLPRAPCCDGPEHHCPADSAAWANDAVWRQLDFQIDEPALFQYSYQGDAQSFHATAVGDLDCDGTTITFELQGTVRDGVPYVVLSEPPDNAH